VIRRIVETTISIDGFVFLQPEVSILGIITATLWHLFRGRKKMTKVSEYAGDGKRTPILVALIGAAAVIIVGYWQYYSKPEKKEFIGRVIEAKTEKRIRNAKVSLEVQGVPPVIYTDSEGIFSFSLKDADNQVRVRVEAEGYEKFDRLITLSTRTGVEEIQLSLAQPNPQSDRRL